MTLLCTYERMCVRLSISRHLLFIFPEALQLDFQLEGKMANLGHYHNQSPSSTFGVASPFLMVNILFAVFEHITSNFVIGFR